MQTVDALPCEETKSCVAWLRNRGHAHQLFIAEPRYGTIVWADQQLQVDDSDFAFSAPIGLVLEGALEVSEQFARGTVVRRRTTKILRPGEFFGLFEALGGLRGYWEIVSGVRRFLVTNPLGNSQTLRRKGWDKVSEPQVRTLKHRANASFDYSDLIDFALSRGGDASLSPRETREETAPSTAIEWKSKILLLDLEEIEDCEALMVLWRKGVAQLSSLARQNPPDALFEDSPRASENAEQLKVAATLDAILADHIPVFGPYRPGHEAYGPFALIQETIRHLATSLEGTVCPSELPVHLWVPEYWSEVARPGALYIDALASRFDMKSADSLLRVGHSGRVLRSGTRLERLDSRSGIGVRMTTTEGQSALICRLAVQRKEGRIPPDLHGALFPNDIPQCHWYGWPLHLGNGLFIKPVE